MCEELSYHIISTSAVNKSVFVIIISLQKSLYKKNISVGGSEQHRDTLF